LPVSPCCGRQLVLGVPLRPAQAGYLRSSLFPLVHSPALPNTLVEVEQALQSLFPLAHSPVSLGTWCVSSLRAVPSAALHTRLSSL
jgi:hypothetical protein